jgi:hypothetical protein
VLTRERWPGAWRMMEPWGWPLAVAVGAVLLVAVAHLVTLAFRPMHDTGQSGERQPPQPRPDNREVETPEAAAEHRHGVWILWLVGGALVVLVLLAAVGETLVHDNRPADYFQPLAPRPMPNANLLQGYHWVDQSQGVVQIPIDRAMDLVLQRGLPSRGPADSQAYIDHGQGGPSDSSGGRSP